MSTDAKRAGNSRYLAKFRTITIRLSQEEKQRIEQAAAQAGESVAGYILRAIRQRMAGEE